MTLEPLMRVCAVSLQCIVLALLFIDDILYNDVPVFDLRSRRRFLCTRGARGCNAENCVLLLDDCHSSSKEICGGREARTMGR